MTMQALYGSYFEWRACGHTGMSPMGQGDCGNLTQKELMDGGFRTTGGGRGGQVIGQVMPGHGQSSLMLAQV